jgi:RNA 2',3'-cyclic 3'-phosphodiesterase
MSATTRVFLAVDIGAAPRRRVEQFLDRCRATGAEVNWVAAQNLHLTVKFLGDLPDAQIAQVCRAAEETACGLAPWDLELVGVGAFPHLGRPTTLWIGCAAGHSELSTLAGRLDASLETLGFPRETRPFSAHLTFGRIKRASAGLPALKTLLQAHTQEAFGPTRIDRLIVFSSDLKPTGPIYTPLAECPLGAK